MRTIGLGVFCSLLFVACNSNSKNSHALEEAVEGSTKEVELVGADVDVHGCKGSAGYVWSQLREDCIRVFEEGVTLLPIELDESEAVFAAFIVYSNDGRQIELFLPKEKASFLLQKTTKNTFEKDKYRFDEHSKELYIDGEAAYKEDAV